MHTHAPATTIVSSSSKTCISLERVLFLRTSTHTRREHSACSLCSYSDSHVLNEGILWWIVDTFLEPLGLFKCNLGGGFSSGCSHIKRHASDSDSTSQAFGKH